MQTPRKYVLFILKGTVYYFMCPRSPPVLPQRVAYLTFGELQADATKMPEPWVILKQSKETLTMGQVDEQADVVVKVAFEGNFIAKASRYGIIVQKSFDVEVSGLRKILQQLEAAVWCPGSEPRSKKCPLIVEGTECCIYCQQVTLKQNERKRGPILPKTPLASAPVESIIQEVKSVRAKLKHTEAELRVIRRKLKTGTVDISSDVKEGLGQVLESSTIEDPFLKLFWEEQQKAASRDARGMRWHPMMIRFAIFLHYQSARAYEALKNTGVLYLPNKSTLKDYTNFFKPSEGFQPHVFEEIKTTAQGLPTENRYVALMHDEMSIRGDLVYDRRGGDVVGFINPQTLNFTPERDMSLATHVLVFMAVGVNSHIKVSLGYFATLAATADVLFSLLWQSIGYLEQQGLKVISSTSDKASPNQRMIRLHGDQKIVHETLNPYAEEERPIFFISDAPHLIKTIRNNLEHSKSGGTRCLWNNNQHLWWNTIFRVYLDDTSSQLRMTKLRDEHVRLTSASRMSVRLAAQVLSYSVGAILRDRYGDDVQELAKFIILCDKFFDCLNSRSFTEHLKKRKPDLAPYRTVQDPRFQFLEDFVSYLETWKINVQKREKFSKAEKEKMFLTHQTYEGIVTTVKGFIGATKYMLGQGVPYIFSNVFCQDPVEEHFGRHRGLGNRSRNPSVYEFGHQENKLRLQRSLAFSFNPKGNTSGRALTQRTISIDNEPLPKLTRK